MDNNMKNRIMLICFDDGTWKQFTVKIDESICSAKNYLEKYIEEYEKTKLDNEVMKLVAPSIMYVNMFID